MRRVLSVLLVAAIVVAAAWYLASLPGTVTAHIGTLTAETSTPVAGFVLLLGFIVLYAVIRALAFLLRMPTRLRAWRGRRSRRIGDLAVTRALVALAAGDAADARREAQRARRALGDTAQTLLLAAEAGRAAQREDEASAAFRLLAEREDAAFLGLRGLLRQAIEQEDWPEAAALARRAEAAHPGAVWLRGERWHLALRAGDWTEALALAPPDGPRAALATAAAGAEPDANAARRLAKRAFEADPALAPAALAYAQTLRDAGKERRALAVIRRAWAAAPHPDLATFVLAPLAAPLDRYRAATRLAEANPSHVESLVLQGRAALAAGLTGEARRHAELARGATSQRRVWMLLADIAEAETADTESGRQALRATQAAALRAAATAGPDPAWRCAACGMEHAAWHPICPSCRAPGLIGWATPPTPVVLPLRAQQIQQITTAPDLTAAPGLPSVAP